MLELLWPFLILNSRILGLISRKQHILFKIIQLLSYLTTAIEVRMVERGRPIFGAKFKACIHKMFHIFHFLQSDMVFAIINPFS